VALLAIRVVVGQSDLNWLTIAHITLARLCLGVFLSSLETTIIATALVTISSDLGHFDKSSWIVVAYLLTYTGNGQAIYLCGTTLISNRFNDYIHKNERYFWQEASPPRCSRVLHSVVVGMRGSTNYRGAVRNLMHDLRICSLS